VERYFVIISSKFLKSEFLNFTTFVSSILESFREVIATANLEFVPPISATKVFNSLGPITLTVMSSKNKQARLQVYKMEIFF